MRINSINVSVSGDFRLELVRTNVGSPSYVTVTDTGGWSPLSIFAEPRERDERLARAVAAFNAVMDAAANQPKPLDELGDLSSQATGIDQPKVPAGQGKPLDEVLGGDA